MFGIGMPELLVILGVALIVVGPSKLPDLAKSLAKGLNEFRKATDEVKSTITEHESFKDLKDLKDSVQDTVNSIKPTSLLDLDSPANPARPEVTPVVEVKKFDLPSAEAAPIEGEFAPKKPAEDMTGRMAMLDGIVSEHQQAEQAAPAPQAAPAVTPEKPAEPASPAAAPKANA